MSCSGRPQLRIAPVRPTVAELRLGATPEHLEEIREHAERAPKLTAEQAAVLGGIYRGVRRRAANAPARARDGQRAA